ncbi:hypothetical protein BC830DRAFT_1169073 [Chytriomyces sp. MP71]|nr:hypothetical protein BC830DRAFT_1169073 [Chytriomyces sp. MP71]
MSFDIDWEALQDGQLAGQLQDWINDRFREIDDQRPAFLGPLSCSGLDFGKTPPTIAIQDIGEVLDDWYLPDDIDIYSQQASVQSLAHLLDTSLQPLANSGPNTHDVSALDSSSSAASSAMKLAVQSLGGSMDSPYNGTHPPLPHSALHPSAMGMQQPPNKRTHSVEDIVASYAQSMRRETDFQIEILVEFKGDFKLTIQTELIVNQPTPAFITLPLALSLTGFSFTAIAVIAYLGDRINFCFKEIGDNRGLFSDISIDSEIGDKDRQVLKNVGKIEKFVVEQVKNLVSDHMVYPNYHCLSLINEDEADDGNSFFGQS